MAKRKLHEVSNASVSRIAKVYSDSETNEFVVKLYQDGQYYEPADYFTNDFDIACAIAERMVEE